jgi:hypothetical protein
MVSVKNRHLLKIKELKKFDEKRHEKIGKRNKKREQNTIENQKE